MKIYTQILIIGLIALTTVSCTSDKSENSLLIFAAASMTDVLNAIVDEYENQNSGVKIAFNYGGSQSLAAQLNQGAPGDIFISAGSEPVDFLIRSQKIRLNPIPVIALNRLVIVTRSNDDLSGDIGSLKSVQRIAIADPDLAPAGSYARESLKNVRLWSSLEQKIVFAPDVRSTLNYVKTANVDAGIVYYTDALSVPELIKHELIPVGSHQDIVYPVVIPSEGVNARKAAHLAEFLQGDFAREMLRKYGFLVPEHDIDVVFPMDRDE